MSDEQKIAAMFGMTVSELRATPEPVAPTTLVTTWITVTMVTRIRLFL